MRANDKFATQNELQNRTIATDQLCHVYSRLPVMAQLSAQPPGYREICAYSVSQHFFLDRLQAALHSEVSTLLQLPSSRV